MRLLTHNYLQSNVKGTEKGYPLAIEPTKINYEETPMDVEFLKSLLPKLDYKALIFAIQQLSTYCDDDDNNNNADDTNTSKNSEDTADGIMKKESLSSLIVTDGLPEELDLLQLQQQEGQNGGTELEILQKLHRMLFDIHIVEGHLICPDTGRRFPITAGIPNMILHEDEI